MYRYISFIWNAADPQATETAHFLQNTFTDMSSAWQTAYDGSGLCVMHRDEEPNRMQAYALPTQDENSGGVVVGKLLTRDRRPEAVSRNAHITVPEARRVIHTSGRALVEDYWGTYVAFFQRGPRKYVLVDPMGQLPCYKTGYRGVEIYFTYMPDVAACRFLDFSIDWPVIAKGLIYPVDHTRVPICEMTKIKSGECVTITPEGTAKTFYWNPQKITQTDVIEDVDEASRTLRQAILATVTSMAAPYDGAIDMIGGLDSSILMAALAQVPAPFKLTGLNSYEEDPGGDERYYVRQTCHHLGVPLIEHKAEVSRFTVHGDDMVPITPWPTDHCVAPTYKKFIHDRLTENGGGVIFNGSGGDEMLYCHGKNYAVIDYLKTHGIRPPLFRLIMEASRMQQRSVWSILPSIMRDGFGKNRIEAVAAQPTSLLTAQVQDMVEAERQREEQTVHPWLEFRENVTPGKIDHIEPLIFGQYKREEAMVPEHFFETLRPYLSLPVIETCLRIPLWVLLADGKGRGLARKAFKDLLPPEVVWRSSKSLSGKYFWSYTLANLDKFRELLMDGELVREGLLDRASLEKTLNRDHDIELRDFAGVHSYLSAELWARKMKGETFADIVRSNVA
ncbi:asparagine synthase C-terminal domain-containing protein [Paremcibacter congregatus]|uniref:asparagine synthase (glutamine-hydrolyzing) n=1 Tax=Paremcibacter congregatus TaxID=2043170 RepID=A0A2G4YMN3_9PROT|nr:asparagine synthase C-terminal domain-containing protein [Paremcibacter congregatus]PHZ83568.1 hypothetical protein CRD36_16515 [Paremcibacter congregatus]QDE28346.1 asparagine synthase [Paremcibacter congregatus]